MNRRRGTRILAATAAMLCLGGGVTAASLGLAAGPAAGPATITVTAGKPSELKFTISMTTIPAGTVVFKVVNRGKKPHNFVIAGKKTALIAPGKSATLTVVFAKAGSFAYRSTVSGQAAMKGVFTVSAPPATTTTTAPAPAPPVASACANPVATTVNVQLFEFGITLSQTSFPCGTVTFNVTNTGMVGHNFDVLGVTGGVGGVLAAGGSGSMTATFTKAGSFPYRCDQGNHAAQGMAGTLTVT
jgi:plastocyanin